MNINNFQFSKSWISGIRGNLLPALFLISFAFFQCKQIKEEETVRVNQGPTVSTLPPTGWGQFFITMSGSIGSDGNSGEITDRGFFYVKDPTGAIDFQPNTPDRQTVSLGAGPPAFQVKIEGLEQNTIYAFRAFAQNSKGINVGETVWVSTNYGPLPTLETIAGIAARSARDTFFLASNLLNEGGTKVDEAGFLISTTANALITSTSAKVFKLDTIMGTGPISDTIFGQTNLTQNTLYYVRAYARNRAGVAYSTEIPLTTSGSSEVILGSIRQSLSSVRIDGRIEETGLLNLDSVGFLLLPGSSTQAITLATPNVKVFSKLNAGLGDFSFDIPVAGNFEVGAKYRLRAFSRNARGVVYSPSNSTVFTFCPVGGYFEREKGFIFWANAAATQAAVVLDTVLQGPFEWGCIGDSIGTSAQINTSKTNTGNILTRCSTAGIAARAARSLGASIDLPSLGDMNLIYDTLYSKGIGTNTYDPTETYWTSSQTTESRASGIQFGTGSRTTQAYKKNQVFKVKAVTTVTF